VQSGLFNAVNGVFHAANGVFDAGNSSCLTTKTGCFVPERGVLHAENNLYRAENNACYTPKTASFVAECGLSHTENAMYRARKKVVLHPENSEFRSGMWGEACRKHYVSGHKKRGYYTPKTPRFTLHVGVFPGENSCVRPRNSSCLTPKTASCTPKNGGILCTKRLSNTLDGGTVHTDCEYRPAPKWACSQPRHNAKTASI
jgi:hypothetical protein